MEGQCGWVCTPDWVLLQGRVDGCLEQATPQALYLHSFTTLCGEVEAG